MSRNERSKISELKDRLRYAFFCGVLRWSMFMIVMSSLSDMYIEHRTLDNDYFQRKVLIFTVAGFILGVILWSGNGRYKQQHTEKGE